MSLTITVTTDQPFADQPVTNRAQEIAEELEESGSPFRVTVKQNDHIIAAWEAK